MREGTTEPSPGSVERLKSVIDALKHLTTLNAGSIVVIGTFLADIFPKKDGTVAVGLGLKLTIAAAFLFFGLSLIVGAFGLTNLSYVGEYLSYEDSYVRGSFLRVLVLITVYSFVLGLLCFGSAVLINLF